MSDQFTQVPFTGVEFVDNPEPRCACLLLLDNSGSMNGQPIEELNQGLQSFQQHLLGDEIAMKRVEVGIVTFGHVRCELEFTGAQAFQAPQLRTAGDTPMGAAIEYGLDMLESRKAQYKSAGISYYRPWVFLMTDGGPTDAWQNAAQRIQAGEQKKSFSFYAVGVQNADMTVLTQLSPARPPLKLQGLHFRELFLWLSSSLSAVSQSQVGGHDTAVLPSPQGWAAGGG